MQVNYYTPKEPWKDFEEAYVNIRNKEGRIVSDEQLRDLPFLPAEHPLYKEWKLRAFSFDRFKRFIPKKSSVLDLGCGNGWMTAQIADLGNQVVGVDVNEPELVQAARVFNNPNISFAFADVFIWEPEQSFDLVIIASAIQYFPSPKDLLKRLFDVNKTLSKIIISDSPFYAGGEKQLALERSKNYYENNDVKDMGKHYYHHSLTDLGFNFKYIYSPMPKWIRRFATFSPFPIIEISRP